jgi:phosphatidylserine decarboxylase
MIMVGALNVGRIIVRPGKSFKKGDELGYFNLGSTIVMLI